MAKNLESPRAEMQRLIRLIDGDRVAGEKDDHLRERAARRMGITLSRAKVFWYGETDNIRSEEMDRARALSGAQPFEEMENAIDKAFAAAEQHFAQLHAVLADRSREHRRELLLGLGNTLSSRLAGRRLGRNPHSPKVAGGDLEFDR